MLDCFAVTAPGIEPLTAQELDGLGLAAQKPQAQRLPGEEGGGVPFACALRDLYRANLHLRTASRILVRLRDFFTAGFPELVKKASRLEWESFLSPGQPISMHVTCHKSRLYHSDAVAQRVAAAVAKRLGQASPLVKTSEVETSQPAQLVIVRIVHDHCTISVDSSGELLHRRGYRLATAKAPLRETLAAAVLLASGWDTRSPLLDPFCGSGTIAIEAALMGLGLPPGRSRRFAFMDWPGYDPQVWNTILEQVRPLETGSPLIQASDRDAGAVQIAQANAERAGVQPYIEFTQRAVSAITPPPGPGWVVTNPPYGLRVSASKDLRNLYAQLGHVLRQQTPGWHFAILSSDLRLLAQMALPLDTSLTFINGGVSVILARGRAE